jgi:hypothetical protein
MRTLKPSLALASLVGFLTAASCTLITDVDRTKIPTDAGPEGGAPGTGGSSGSGGKGGSSGKGGTGGDSGAGGTGGSTGGSGGSGSVTKACDKAEGTITLNPGVLFADGETITIGDGLNSNVVFEFELSNSGLSDEDHKSIGFDGTEDNAELASLIASAINGQDENLRVSAAIAAPSLSGSGGAAGAAGSAGSGQGGGGDGQGGASGGAAGSGGGPTIPGTVEISLSNEFAGALGNVRIRDTAGNPNFRVSGMTGGKSVECDEESLCTDGAECASGECGDDSFCTQPE